MGVERVERIMQTHRMGEWSKGGVSKSVRQSCSPVSQFLRESGRGGIFTRSKDLGERHLVFATFLTSAWRGGRLRRDGGGGGEVGTEGRREGAEQKDAMTTTITDARPVSNRGAADSQHVCGKHTAKKKCCICLYITAMNSGSHTPHQLLTCFIHFV